MPFTSKIIGTGAVTSTGILDGTILDADVSNSAAIATSKLSGPVTSISSNGLGTAASLDVGTTANKVVQLDGSGKLPAVDGSALTGISAGSTTVSVGRTYNIGITLSAGVLSITQANGSALSSGASSGYVVVPSTTAGQTATLNFTSAQTLQDGNNGTPQIKGRWGTTASVAWASNMPLFLGVVNKDDTAGNARFFLTRDPTMTTTPSSTNNIGIGGTAPTTSAQGNIVLFGTSANTNYNSKPCVILGSVQATCDNSAGGVWTIATLSKSDGIGLFNEDTLFTFPTGQNGAATGTYIQNNTQTAPVFSSNTYLYKLYRNGQCYVNINLSGDGGTDGAGAVDTLLELPYATPSAYPSQSGNIGLYVFCPTYETGNAWGFITNGTPDLDVRHQTSVTAQSKVSLADFSNGNRAIQASFMYPAF